MAETERLHCEPCMHEYVTNSASKWCTDCKERLCADCCRRHKAHKMSKIHHVIPLEECQQFENLHVNLHCPEHSKPFEAYCPTHDSVICLLCVQLRHGGCEDLMPLDEAAKGAKMSNADSDLDQAIDELQENIEKGVRQLQQNKTNLEEQEYITKKSIAAKRAELNKHLDRLEEKLKLKSKSEKAVKEISLLTTKLETQRQKISTLKDTAQHMKQVSSNLQVFVGIRSVLKTVFDEINGIKSLVDSIKQQDIAFQINPKFDTFIETFDTLGEIQITSKEEVVQYVERQLTQAQYQRPAVHKLDNLQLQLRTNIKMREKISGVTSCLILPNKCMMIASNSKPSIIILKEDGSHDREIRVKFVPYDITIIDDQRVAVSYGDTCISIVNIIHPRTNQTLENLSKHGIWGITYNDGKLYAVVMDEGIKVIDLDGKIIKTILKYKNGGAMFKVTTQKDKIYYSDNNGSVYCVDMKGTKIWTYHEYQLSPDPAIAVDSYGITFAAGSNNNLLLAISPDGKQQKVLLTSSDGLQKPQAVYYDKASKLLLVGNYANEHAALYDVIY